MMISGGCVLYVLEVNPYGAVWAPFIIVRQKTRFNHPEYFRARYVQFNALDRAADLLIQKTCSDAR